MHCRHYDENVAKECKEPFAEVPGDKESANFCDLYQIGDGEDRGGNAPVLILRVRPAWAQTWRWKSSPEQVTAREGKRQGGRVTDRPEEAWNEPAGR